MKKLAYLVALVAFPFVCYAPPNTSTFPLSLDANNLVQPAGRIPAFNNTDAPRTAHGNSGASVDFDMRHSYHTVTVSQATTFTFSHAPATGGILRGMLIRILNNGFAVTWPGTIATAPLINPTASSITNVFVETDSAGLAYTATSSFVPNVEMQVVMSDETTAITTGNAKTTWRAPYAFTILSVRASLNTVSSSGIPTVDINESGTTILSTKLTIDANELTSATAATAAVISDATIADNAEITMDIDVAGTGAKGLKVWVLGYR